MIIFVSTDEMGRDIISSAKEIILRKNTRTEDKVLEDRMERIEDKMQGLEDKLDKILTKLSIQWFNTIIEIEMYNVLY